MVSSSLGYDMQVSANDGDLLQLQAQLSQWESQGTDKSITQEDYLGFSPSPIEYREVYLALNRPHPIGTDQSPIESIYFMLNRLIIQAARRDQVHVLRYLLEERNGLYQSSVWRGL